MGIFKFLLYVYFFIIQVLTGCFGVILVSLLSAILYELNKALARNTP